MLSIKSGQTHYKQKSRNFGSQSRLRDSKPHNNALHAFCGIETIELPLRSSHKKTVFVVIKKRNLQLLYLIHKMQVLQEVLLRF